MKLRFVDESPTCSGFFTSGKVLGAQENVPLTTDLLNLCESFLISEEVTSSSDCNNYTA
ncbi:hypothetical protein FBY05_113156 [Pseudomonas sp. SJZ083]|jgi:hypothetical protein|nr:hypothetical protein [Pseudomonas silensiensis]TWC18352.1 hypothetical protein FBY05_113156 [Pseudomonas sp. SJZ083]TWC45590.1 hypothetical protein FBY01_11336 [Pseudomonas sp. SJZ077]